MGSLEFLLVFHASAAQGSATAILRTVSADEAKRNTRAIAAIDGRSIELWRDQKLIAKFVSDGDLRLDVVT